MRGRYPSGPEYVEHLEGSAQAKRRLRVVLETMTGKYRVQEACRLLDICEQRFYQLRNELLQAALEQLEPKPVGRPRRQAEPEAVTVLQAQLLELERELQAAQVREEIALLLPNRMQDPAEPGKKSPLPPKG